MNGVKEGDETYYSLSGKKALSTPFTNGKQNGEIIVFNEKEEVVLRKNFYYDLPCGSEIEYRENTIRKYSFFSLENELLFELDYDSIQRREIHEAVSGFFFFRVEDIDVIGNGLDENAKRIFLYLLAPPSYDFRYSIVKLKPDGTSGPIVHSFDSTMGWGAYELPANSKPGELAICLNLTDPVGGRITMLKNLKW
ncbi:MAG: hypothetical protein EOO16_08465 [Chitinophagaceae bacterium]|nr:MAG: hypothetical protein EOO16_08465 [Chitinophagaceae bacterium]